VSRLGGLQQWPAAAPSVAPHNYRVVGDRVFISNDGGYSASLSVAEYKRFRQGLEKGDALGDRLQRQGFAMQYLDFNALGAGYARLSLLAWQGPSLHVLRLHRGQKAMSLALIRSALEHAFASPAPGLAIEMHVDHVAKGLEGQAFFVGALAHRLAEWSGRGVELTLTVEHAWPDEKTCAVLREQGAALRRYVPVGGAPKKIPAVPSGLYVRALAIVDATAKDAAGWVKRLQAAGYNSVRLQPAPACPPEKFAQFYNAALDALLELEAAGAGLREEWSLLALSRLLSAETGGRAALDAGLDYLTELAYDPDGSVRSAFGGWAVGRPGKPSIAELKEDGMAGAALDAQEGDLQPLCFHCVYKPFCRLSASKNQHSQGSLWGRTVDSTACGHEMARYDALFSRLADPGQRSLLEKWYF
jgi:hypothetical protein